MIPYADLSEVVRRGRERFNYDDTYRFTVLSDAFARRSMTDDDDTALLERICTAYIKAAEHEGSASRIFEWRLCA